MREILNVLSCLLIAGVTGVATAHAEGKKPSGKAKESLHDQFSGQGYGAAGCGLGSVVFGAKPGLVQVVAATLNNTAANQTFGITSGTSNCDIPESGQQAALFIEINKEVLRKEAARGGGETVQALSEILMCDSADGVGAELKANYNGYFGGNADSFETVRRLLNSLPCNKG